MGVPGIFEEFIAGADADLKALRETGDDLVAAIRAAADAKIVPAADGLAALDDARRSFIGRQHAVHAELAAGVEEISAAIDHEQLLFDRRETPSRLDVLIGRVSKRRMRRRIERRAAHSGGLERLQLVLGRADRLAGLVEAQRKTVTAQRSAGEEALAALLAYRSEILKVGGDKSDLPEATVSAIERAITPFNAIIDGLSTAVRDQTALIHKLAFDIEHLLDLHGVLSQFDRGQTEGRLVPAAYPYFSRSVSRYDDGLLPGARLNSIRQMVDHAFFKQFAGD